VQQETGRRVEAEVKERRRYPRLRCRFRIRFKVIDEATSVRPYRSGVTVDLSRGGLRFVTDRAVGLGDCLAVHLTIPGRGRIVAALAEVLRTKTVPSQGAGGRPRVEVGARFLWSGWHDGEMQREIADFVREELERR